MEGFEEHDMVLLDDSNTVERFPDPEDLPCFTVLSYDRAKQPAVANLIGRAPFQSSISDEIHYLQSPTSKRSKSILKSTRHIPYKIGLTGTLIGNKPDDAFTPLLWSDGGETLGSNYWQFRKEYYIKLPHGGWTLKRGAKELLQRKIDQAIFSVHEDQVLDLPPVRTITKSIPPTNQQIKRINRLIDEWEYEVDGITIEVSHVVAKIAKLKQIAGGFMYGTEENGKQAKWITKGKIRATTKLANDLLQRSPKLVIWAYHGAEVTEIVESCQQAGLATVGYTATSRRGREDIRRAFRDDQGLKIFVAQADQGVGMNELTGANTAIYFSNSPKVKSRKQSKARIRRKGSEHHDQITYYDVVTEGTIDETNLESLRAGMDLADYLVHKVKDPEKVFRKLRVTQSIPNAILDIRSTQPSRRRYPQEMKPLLPKLPRQYGPPLIPERMIWTQSALGLFRRCPRKFFWKYILRARPSLLDPNLAVGGAMHTCLENWYSFKRCDMGPIVNREACDLEEYIRVEGGYYNQDDLTRFIGDVRSLRGMMNAYARIYAADRKQWQLSPKRVEVEFSVPFEDFDYNGKIDLIPFPTSKAHAIVEHKTARSIKEGYFERLPLDTQCRGYVLGAHHLGFTKVDRVIYDVVKKCSLRKRAAESVNEFHDRIEEDYESRPSFYFIRFPVTITKDDVEAMIHEMHQTHASYQAIVDGEFGDPLDPRSWAAHGNSCYDFSRSCEYMGSCKGGFTQKEALQFTQLTTMHSELETA